MAARLLSLVFRIALQMLFGDRVKYITLVLSLGFAAMLMNQQGAIFLGLLEQSTGPLQNVHQPDLWVTDPSTPWVAEYRALSDQKLQRVRSVEGVEWAEPYFNGIAICELPNGEFKRVQINGISRTSLVGRPAEVIEGRIEDLWIPDAILVEERSRALLGGVNLGDVLKLNDRRAVVVGIYKARQGFEGNAIICTTFENAVRFTPTGRENISYIFVKVREGVDLAGVQARIDALGDLRAMTKDQFKARSKEFIIVATGIGVNFGITIALGFIVGLLLSASVFYQFVSENLRHFAVLKALGASTLLLFTMVMLQAVVVGIIGFGLGTGAAGLFAIVTQVSQSELTVQFPWQLLAGSGVATIITILLGSVLSIRRVITLSPGSVFGG